MRKTLFALGALFAAITPAKAQDDPAAFYKGKVVRLVVGVGVGSGYDINARLLARYLPKYIPGNPSVIVQNQPGAGSLTMTNQLYAAGPFDGTLIGASFNGLPTTPLLQPTGARFEATKINWIGSTNRETQPAILLSTAPDKQGEVGVVLREGIFNGRDSLDMMVKDKAYLLMPTGDLERGDDYELVRCRQMIRDTG